MLVLWGRAIIIKNNYSESGMKMNAQERILEAGKSLFLTKGYRTTTTREIAEKAEVNLGLIPYYYKKKENIARIIYSEMLSGFLLEEKYNEVYLEDPIEKLFWCYLYISLRLVETSEYDFYYDLLEADVIPKTSQEYTKVTIREIAEQYRYDIDENQIEIIGNVMKSVEYSLLLQKKQKIYEISHVEVNRKAVEIIVFFLGMDKKDIDGKLNGCLDRVKGAGIDLAVLYQ